MNNRNSLNNLNASTVNDIFGGLFNGARRLVRDPHYSFGESLPPGIRTPGNRGTEWGNIHWATNDYSTVVLFRGKVFLYARANGETRLSAGPRLKKIQDLLGREAREVADWATRLSGREHTMAWVRREVHASLR